MSAPARCVDPFFATRLAAAVPAPDADTSVALVGRAALRVLNNKTAASPARQPQMSQQSECNVRSHSSSPSYANNNGAGSQEMSSVSIRINLPSQTVPSKVRNTAERVQFALQAWGRGKPAPIKQIQHIAEVDQKTASAWYHGKQPPRADHLLTLALHIPELKAEIARLLELEQDQAESFQREAIALLQRYAR